MLCEALEFNHLPVAGGIYDQHPQLLDDWVLILQEKARHEKQKQSKMMKKH